ncbi:Nucleotide diphosphate X, ADP-ribose pyrophosphatase (ADPRase) [Perigonia lusca single nucleopolyhedrovirus]|uniref:Nucleotide diphosphate X, ADP-ribose pyrophosphatase (ADPRase) n=1 Tax=Perigonia lusca single nucleopolyhedrovirus TaxID=1675865 RepID=A0A0M3WP48_9ABAC|nr:Nucleotide diphosphate X, ADP-ribose pyrophosphatase (ADPRase) [Perigonia lusca single nucleopolyhedrovirus]AKN80561.1 Nucleotide diphosphate X, ADP-ribose pyrophosphatase (ADPRase) [Perigonia lusca single nucleopolyhedrovirus]
MRCAGLFMIVEPDHVVLLRAHKSYKEFNVRRPAGFNNDTDKRNGFDYVNTSTITGAAFASTTIDDRIFLEKISIPRGKRDGRDVFDYETAVREFIEETGTFFETAYIYKVPFVLQWNDDGVTYKYAIYVGIVRGSLRYVSLQPNTFCVKLSPNDHLANHYKVQIESRRYNNELRRRLYISTLNHYFKYMNEKQLVTYKSSNYLEFFNFVKNVKAKFEEQVVAQFNNSEFFYSNFNLKILKWMATSSMIMSKTMILSPKSSFTTTWHHRRKNDNDAPSLHKTTNYQNYQRYR